MGHKYSWMKFVCVMALMSVSLVVTNSAQGDVSSDVPRARVVGQGRWYSCTIDVSKRLTCWGQTSGVGVPNDLGPVDSLGLGGAFNCAVTVLKTVRCWGTVYDNGYYRVPDDLGKVRWVGTTGYTACAITTDLVGRCWGNRMAGVTDGLASVGQVLDVSMTFWGHVCAVDVSQLAHCWGSNQGHQNDIPSDLGTVLKISTGYESTCAITTEHLVRCWGDGWYVQPPSDLGEAKDLTVGTYSACAILVDSSIRCWGIDVDGSLAIPDNVGKVIQVSAGWDSFCAVTQRYSVVCWGQDLGSGNTRVPADLEHTLGFLGCDAAPTSLAASNVGATSMTLTFAPPADVTCDVPITAFEFSIDGGATWVTPDFPAASSPLRISGLNFATDYSIQVRAVNSRGPGVPSESISVTTLATPAAAPRLTSTLTASGKVTLAIAAPSVLGDTALTGYDYSINNGSTWSHFTSVTGPFTITGLTNGTAYQVKVRAVNSAGPGAASEAVTVNPTKLVPATPAIASISRGNAQATVTVATPTGVTAQSITGYQYNLNNGALWKPVTLTDGSFTITGLANGSNYAVQIRAVNVNGLSGLSGKVSVTPMTTAAATTIQSIKSLNGGLAVTFGGVAIDNGGSVAKNYQYSLDGGSTWTDCNPVLKLSPLMTIKGLTNGTTYQVAIRMVNAVGAGAASNVVAATPMTTPSAPVVSNASVGKSTATLTLGSSANGGSAISGYAYSLDNKTWTTVTPVSGQFTVSGLIAFKSYKIYVRASNVMGNGVAGSTTVKTLK